MGEWGEGWKLMLAIGETSRVWLGYEAGAAPCLSFPPGIKEGPPLPGVSCDFGILGGAAEAEPKVSGVGWNVGSSPWWLGLGAGCMSHKTMHLRDGAG